MAGDNKGASSWSGGEKTRNVDKVSDKTFVAIYSRTASKFRTNFVTVVSEAGHGNYKIASCERRKLPRSESLARQWHQMYRQRT